MADFTDEDGLVRRLLKSACGGVAWRARGRYTRERLLTSMNELEWKRRIGGCPYFPLFSLGGCPYFPLFSYGSRPDAKEDSFKKVNSVVVIPDDIQKCI
jgi:hypothetical protein